MISKVHAEGLVVGLKGNNLVYPIPEDTEQEMISYLTKIEPFLAVTKLQPNSFRISQYPDQGVDSAVLQYISFRRLIVNRIVGLIKPTLGQNIADVVTDLLGFYDSDFFMRELLRDKKMVELLHNCPEPYSLLGKMKTNDFSTGDERIKTMPLLIIPGECEAAREWESRYQSDRSAEMVSGFSYD